MSAAHALPAPSLNAGEQRAIVVEGLEAIERFAAALTAEGIEIGRATLLAGLDDIRLQARRLRERGAKDD